MDALSLVNTDSIQVWRKKAGFIQTIEQYTSGFKYQWDADEYKKVLPELIQNKNVTDSAGIRFVK